jgi:hypothetical protein
MSRFRATEPRAPSIHPILPLSKDIPYARLLVHIRRTRHDSATPTFPTRLARCCATAQFEGLRHSSCNEDRRIAIYAEQDLSAQEISAV